MMFPTMVDVGKLLQEVLKKPAEEKQVLEVKEILARFTTDVIGSCAFGIEVKSLVNPDVKFRQLGQQLIKPNPIEAIRNLLFFTFPQAFNFLKVSLLFSLKLSKGIVELSNVIF